MPRPEDWKNFLPPKPFLEESRESDWRFEIRFVVKILPPEEARKTADPGKGKPPTTAPATQPMPRPPATQPMARAGAAASPATPDQPPTTEGRP